MIIGEPLRADRAVNQGEQRSLPDKLIWSPTWTEAGRGGDRDDLLSNRSQALVRAPETPPDCPPTANDHHQRHPVNTDMSPGGDERGAVGNWLVTRRPPWSVLRRRASSGGIADPR